MCQGLVAGLPSDCPGLTWRCWWWQRKEFGFWSNHFPAWSSGWIVFNKCAVPPKSLEFNYSTYNPQNSWYGTFVRVSMLLQPLYWQNILKDGIHIHFGSLNSSGTVGQGFGHETDPTQVHPWPRQWCCTPHPQPTPRYSSNPFGCVVGVAAQPRGQPCGQTPVRWGSFPPPKKPRGRNLLRSWPTSTMMHRGVSGTKEIKLCVPASNLLPMFLQKMLQ